MDGVINESTTEIYYPLNNLFRKAKWDLVEITLLLILIGNLCNGLM